ncbi:hypothetical protein K9N50_07505 [bacterium]|nr:hypothetical protein [bacterium]
MNLLNQFSSIKNVVVISSVLVVNSFLYSQSQNFSKRIDLGIIQNDKISEASGLAKSRIYKDVLYTHNDSGGKNVIYVIDKAGKSLGELIIDGCKARDWEDIAVAPGPSKEKSYIYIANIGDNKAVRSKKYIYRFPEPELKLVDTPFRLLIQDAETITFQYPDGNRDAETLLVDSITLNLYVITKREENVRIYCLPYPQSTSEVIIADFTGELGLTLVVGGDILSSGTDVIIKTYERVYIFNRKVTENVTDVFKNSPVVIPSYIPEPKGEGICWETDGSGFYTISEEKHNKPAHLYFYKRID